MYDLQQIRLLGDAFPMMGREKMYGGPMKGKPLRKKENPRDLVKDTGRRVEEYDEETEKIKRVLFVAAAILFAFFLWRYKKSGLPVYASAMFWMLVSFGTMTIIYMFYTMRFRMEYFGAVLFFAVMASLLLPVSQPRLWKVLVQKQREAGILKKYMPQPPQDNTTFQSRVAADNIGAILAKEGGVDNAAGRRFGLEPPEPPKTDNQAAHAPGPGVQPKQEEPPARNVEHPAEPKPKPVQKPVQKPEHKPTRKTATRQEDPFPPGPPVPPLPKHLQNQ